MTDPRPTKWAVVQYWSGAPLGHDVFAPHLSIESPCCFACGWHSERWTEGRSPKAAWERARLERAHIVPAGLGGSSKPDNIILLCAPCHHESPDWIDPWEMARWISTRPDRPSKEVEVVGAWIEAAAQVPNLFTVLGDAATAGRSAEWFVGLMRESARQAVVHGAGVGLSQATMEAILRDATKKAAQF